MAYLCMYKIWDWLLALILLDAKFTIGSPNMFASYISRTCTNWRRYKAILFLPPMATSSLGVRQSVGHEPCGLPRWYSARLNSNAEVTLNTDNEFPRFSIGKPIVKRGVEGNRMQKPKRPIVKLGVEEDRMQKPKQPIVKLGVEENQMQKPKRPIVKLGVEENQMEKPKRPKMSRKAKLNELRWYRLLAKKKMRSPNPKVRIEYKLQKAKRKEEWLIEKLMKINLPKGPMPVHDPEVLTVEERFYLKRTGEKKKRNYVSLGRRGVFGGVVLNMHLHWKKHETVKVVCKPCRPGQVHEYAEEIARLSKGIIIDIHYHTVIFYRGKNYVQPEVMSPPDTLSKWKALEKYKYEQSLEHTSEYIEKLEKELEEYHHHVAMYKKHREEAFSNK